MYTLYLVWARLNQSSSTKLVWLVQWSNCLFWKMQCRDSNSSLSTESRLKLTNNCQHQSHESITRVNKKQCYVSKPLRWAIKIVLSNCLNLQTDWNWFSLVQAARTTSNPSNSLTWLCIRVNKKTFWFSYAKLQEPLWELGSQVLPYLNPCSVYTFFINLKE